MGADVTPMLLSETRTCLPARLPVVVLFSSLLVGVSFSFYWFLGALVLWLFPASLPFELDSLLTTCPYLRLSRNRLWLSRGGFTLFLTFWLEYSLPYSLSLTCSLNFVYAPCSTLVLTSSIASEPGPQT